MYIYLLINLRGSLRVLRDLWNLFWSYRAQHGELGTQLGANMPNLAPNMTNLASNMANLAPNMANLAPNMANLAALDLLWM